MNLFRKTKASRGDDAPRYGILFFDHIQGELASLKDLLSETDKKVIVDLREKRAQGTLTWDDIYLCQLMLLKHLDFETLKSKILSLRIRYQCLVGATDYQSYVATRAVDLSVQNGPETIQLLTADYKYLLDEFFLGYAYISAREELRTKLLMYGAALTLFFFLIAGSVATLAFTTGNRRLVLASSIVSTTLVVIFAGATGAFMSMQQRLQSVNNQGDPIYNLSLLTHGWFSIFLSPLSGAIFAVVLYLFFAGGLLTGAIFPKIDTLDAPTNDIVVTVEESPDTTAGESAGAQETPSTETGERSSSVAVRQNDIVGLTDFFPQTGPGTGKDFALLLIWSFVAGFAERLVPDTVVRLVNQKSSIEGKAAA